MKSCRPGRPQPALSEAEESGCAATLLAGGMRSWLLRRYRFWRDIYDFPWTSVVELLAGFFLDAFRVALELANLLGILIVLFLQLADFFLQVLILGALGPVNHHAIGA